MHVVIADTGETMLRIIAAPLIENGDKVALFTAGARSTTSSPIQQLTF